MLFKIEYSQCKKKQSLIVSEEMGNKHILKNKSLCNVYQYRIDGGILKDSNGERCDYIVEADKLPQPYAYIIELKGSDLNKAIMQIEKTIDTYKMKLSKYIIFPRIVIHRTHTHDIRGKKFRDFKKKFPELDVKERKHDLDVV